MTVWRIDAAGADRRAVASGVIDAEQYRALTNAMMEGVFGMDVEGMRRYKNLAGRSENLRDHLSDLELVLVALC